MWHKGLPSGARPNLERMEGFDDQQAAAILSAAEEARSPVYRWIPLLCALSGARVAEIAQLRGGDVRQTDGIWHMQIRAAAGSVKNATSERDVPLHPYLISSGFVDFAHANGAGPLFFDPRRRNNNARKPQPKIVSKNVASWVNKLDVGVGRENRKDPNHAWRHWFRTRLAPLMSSTA
jgi:integrase